MSRAQPLPRFQSQGTNGTPHSSHPLSAPGTTIASQYSRPGSRTSTPVGSHYGTDHAPPNTPLGPSRQQRSEHRPNYSTSDRAAPSQDPDSVTTMHRDIVNVVSPSRTDPSNSNFLLQNSMLSRSPIQDQTSPNSLHSALAAFQSAGSRRRQTVEEGESYHSHHERERELEAERARQQRIRDKAPGLRTKGTKVGEIDGMLKPFHC
jgi:exocyst complex component 4